MWNYCVARLGRKVSRLRQYKPRGPFSVGCAFRSMSQTPILLAHSVLKLLFQTLNTCIAGHAWRGTDVDFRGKQENIAGRPSLSQGLHVWLKMVWWQSRDQLDRHHSLVAGRIIIIPARALSLVLDRYSMYCRDINYRQGRDIGVYCIKGEVCERDEQIVRLSATCSVVNVVLKPVEFVLLPILGSTWFYMTLLIYWLWLT